MNPVSFYKCLSDDTRLKCLLLITLKGEMCVCDLISALKLSQPKVSRHLAELRKCEILADDRRGKWVFYQLNQALPQWALEVLRVTTKDNSAYLEESLKNLDLANQQVSCC
ncbi:metalloregulator ArsR/SmtB family transcription factor [Paraglaciecola arctica]|uniref:metalloregulator ArsR/SmtB family transcription factor n=1 Tax=Paraglaciecola arctica TaxID=1128911 RepID=UPI001C0691ED|nr:metalloregulator ArsR/SmtB family transcription factor [Paraglaciecola arctica]MBU3004579.1 metalloregulator ArsR/SmtB family transcription factor [Paraglaciecola arctica]